MPYSHRRLRRLEYYTSPPETLDFTSVVSSEVCNANVPVFLPLFVLLLWGTKRSSDCIAFLFSPLALSVNTMVNVS